MGLDLLHNCEADNRWNDWGFSDYLALDRMLLDSHHVTKGHYWPKECASRQKRRAAAEKLSLGQDDLELPIALKRDRGA